MKQNSEIFCWTNRPNSDQSIEDDKYQTTINQAQTKSTQELTCFGRWILPTCMENNTTDPLSMKDYKNRNLQSLNNGDSPISTNSLSHKYFSHYNWQLQDDKDLIWLVTRVERFKYAEFPAIEMPTSNGRNILCFCFPSVSLNRFFRFPSLNLSTWMKLINGCWTIWQETN